MKHPDGTPWWEVMLGDMIKTGMRLTQVAPDAFPLSVPHLGATDQSIAAAASRLGGSLDGQLEALLRLADGWEMGFQMGNLLSSEELGQGPLWDEANQWLDAFYEEGDSASWPPRHELVPIHASPYDTDVMALWMGGPVTDGGHPVVYFYGEPIDQWPNLYEWWLRMLILQECSLEHVINLTGPSDGPS
ncbi:SMI1/KNR4 family protein [Cellulomonas soli]|uniref:SMI1/KNR4 family protein n=1 Tax=Cellulomonas soli TaxID=931535 RepID=UPI003F83301A